MIKIINAERSRIDVPVNDLSLSDQASIADVGITIGTRQSMNEAARAHLRLRQWRIFAKVISPTITAASCNQHIKAHPPPTKR